MNTYFLYGKEDYDINKKIEDLKKNFLDPQFSSINFKTINNPNYNTLEATLLSQGLMNINTVIVINCEKYFFDKDRIDFSDTELKSLEKILKSNLFSNKRVIFVAKIPRDSQKKIDTRRKIFKVLASNKEKSFEFDEYKPYDKNLPLRVIEIGKSFDFKISAQIAEALIKHSGVNLNVIANQLEKLILSIYPRKIVEINDIKKYCTHCDDIFALIDKLFEKNKDDILIELKSLLFKRHPLEILAVLQSTISNFLFIKNYQNKLSNFEISKQIGIHEYRVKLAIDKMKNISFSELTNLKLALIKTEESIKEGKLNEKLALEIVLLNF